MKQLNLEPLEDFLTKDVDVDYLVNELDKLYYSYTEIAMRLSCIENEPIYKNLIDGRYWIERLKDVFTELK